MPADVAAAWDVEKAQRKGLIYNAGRAAGWKCPNHLVRLERDGNYLFCPRNCVTIFSPPPIPGVSP